MLRSGFAIVFPCAIMLAMPGCADKKNAKQPSAKAEKHDDHDHGAGPHGGTIIELGKYHAEFTVDHPAKKATVYILDGSARKAEPIQAAKLLLSIREPRFQVDMAPLPEEGDPAGKASRFVATHENFGKEREFEGTVSAEIDGTPILGDFKEKAHAGHKH